MSDTNFHDIMRAVRDPSLDGRMDLLQDYFPYETIKYSGRLHFRNGRSGSAVFERHQKIRFTKDAVAIFFDRVWGDGVLFGGYFARNVHILEPIRTGNGYIVPLHLPRLFSAGETFDLFTRRTTMAAFYDARGHWDTAMHAPTDLVTISISAPRDKLANFELSAPPRGDIDAEEGEHRLSFRVARPALYTPYRVSWSWK